jgi:sugar O-acyltransferase (sialic acid O-acetyltransferase NeuD family)
MMEIILWGGTGHARVLREALGAQATILAVFDNRDIPAPFAGVALHVGETSFEAWSRGRQDTPKPGACVAIGGGRGGDRLARMRWLAARGYAPVTVTHPSAWVASDAVFGAGCQFLSQSAVCSSARLGDAVIVNTAASIDHDCVIGDGVHFAPGARAAGEVMIGENAFIGCGAIILPRIRIGAGATVGAGAVVTKDVEPNQTVVGNPARLHQQEKR